MEGRRQGMPHRRPDHPGEAGLSRQAAHERAGYVPCPACSSPSRRWSCWPPAAALMIAAVMAVFSPTTVAPAWSADRGRTPHQTRRAGPRRRGRRLPALHALRLRRERSKAGVDILDFDVRLTADGVLVVQHDEDLQRTTNSTDQVNSDTYAELNALDNAYWFTPLEHVQEPARGRLPVPRHPHRRQAAAGGLHRRRLRHPPLRGHRQAVPELPLNIEIKGNGGTTASAPCRHCPRRRAEGARPEASTGRHLLRRRVWLPSTSWLPTSRCRPGCEAIGGMGPGRDGRCPTACASSRSRPSTKGSTVLTPELVTRAAAGGLTAVDLAERRPLRERGRVPRAVPDGRGRRQRVEAGGRRRRAALGALSVRSFGANSSGRRHSMFARQGTEFMKSPGCSDNRGARRPWRWPRWPRGRGRWWRRRGCRRRRPARSRAARTARRACSWGTTPGWAPGSAPPGCWPHQGWRSASPAGRRASTCSTACRAPSAARNGVFGSWP